MIGSFTEKLLANPTNGCAQTLYLISTTANLDSGTLGYFKGISEEVEMWQIYWGGGYRKVLLAVEGSTAWIINEARKDRLIWLSTHTFHSSQRGHILVTRSEWRPRRAPNIAPSRNYSSYRLAFLINWKRKRRLSEGCHVCEMCACPLRRLQGQRGAYVNMDQMWCRSSPACVFTAFHLCSDVFHWALFDSQVWVSEQCMLILFINATSVMFTLLPECGKYTRKPIVQDNDLDLSYVERKNLHPYYLSNFKKTKVASYCKRSCLHSHMKASTTRLHQLKLVSVMDSTEAKHGSQLNNTQRLIFINEVAAALVILSAGFTLHRVTGSIKLWNHNICDIFKLWNACLGSVWFWMTLVVVKWTAVTCRISCVLEIVGGHNANECALEQSWTPSVNCPLLSFSL